jgi:uncharacterized membrane protein
MTGSLIPTNPSSERQVTSSEYYTPKEPITPAREYIKVYSLWLVGGWMGLHRLYLGYWFSGLLYMCSFGLFGIGWLLDAFFLPKKIKHKYIAKQREQRDSQAEDEPVAIIAPWANEQNLGLLGRLQIWLRLAYLCVAPILLVSFAILLKQIYLAILMLVIMLATSFIGTSYQMFQKHQSYLEKIPVLREISKSFQSFLTYYYHNKPRSFLFYFFYPIIGLPMLLFSASARQEIKLYLRLITVIAVALMVETVISYGDIYPPHLKIDDAILLIFVQLFIIFGAVVSYMIPTATSAFALSLSGRHKSLQYVTIGVVIFSVILGVTIFMQEQERGVGFISSQILDTRMDKPTFREALTEASDMFMLYHNNRAKPKAERHAVVRDQELTDKFRYHIGGLAVRDESQAFSILLLNPTDTDIASPDRHRYQAEDNSTWFAVHLALEQHRRLLYVMDPNGRIYRLWKDLPPTIQNLFVIQAQISTEDKGLINRLSERGLIDDLYRTKKDRATKRKK